jgi:hypothetical protein
MSIRAGFRLAVAGTGWLPALFTSTACRVALPFAAR